MWTSPSLCAFATSAPLCYARRHKRSLHRLPLDRFKVTHRMDLDFEAQPKKQYETCQGQQSDLSRCLHQAQKEKPLSKIRYDVEWMKQQVIPPDHCYQQAHALEECLMSIGRKPRDESIPHKQLMVRSMLKRDSPEWHIKAYHQWYRNG
eukprot:gnl/Spiro4/2299_TR1107_c0_g1_i1.p1 gnl/Spiro4/2299_TR1107_c0_g1~~gnl/Spiro4/2299_TR1107_c0_g1_i1.p1  ORF type:complete len:149 (+),score=21.36 gnl/Spiro4/2299_TR1107_c0_g1_i1:60-506(+)